jgi:protein-disulfide isomerase
MWETHAHGAGGRSERFVVLLLLLATAATVATFFVAPVSQAPTRETLPSPPAAPLSLHGATEGSREAPVVVVEFSDFECPFCAEFARKTLPALKTRYIGSGKVRFVFNHFPLETMHPAALRAAVIAECGRQQGEFWTVHDRLFANQSTLDGVVTNPGKTVSLDQQRLTECLGSEQAIKAVKADIEVGKQLGLTGTPTFFIGTSVGQDRVAVRKVLVGAVRPAAIGEAIDSVLR